MDIGGIVDLIFTVLTIAIIGRALTSWFDPGMRSSVGRVLFEVTEPIISPIRRVVPSMGMIDLSPMIALILLQVLRQILLSALYG
jgi:YggT family protein